MKRKKIVLTLSLILTALLIAGLPSYAVDADEPEVPEELSQLYARSAVLLDADSGRVLFGKEEDVPRPMASTTKIMTCILALENGDTGDVVTASEHAASQPKVRLGVQNKEEFKLGDLLYSLMLESHNDSAVVIAEHIGGSVEGFADMMNAKAKEIGCENTYFVTPNGLDGFDEGGTHSTSAADLARIMKYCIHDSLQKKAFLQITQTQNYSFTNVEGTRNFTCNNHNAFLGMMEGALSGKTGFTGDAGYCYVGALEREGRTFIVALLACGWPNNKGYKWTDTKKLMTYGVEHYQYRNVWEDADLSPIKVINGIPDSGQIKGRSTVKLSMQKEELNLLLREDEQVEMKLKKEESLEAPVSKGTVVGSAQYYLDGGLIKEYEIKTTEDVKERTFAWCFQQLGFLLNAS